MEVGSFYRTGQICLLPIIQYFFRFHSIRGPTETCRCHLASLCLGDRSCGCGKQCKNVDTLPTAIPESNQLSFLSDLGILSSDSTQETVAA